MTMVTRWAVRLCNVHGLMSAIIVRCPWCDVPLSDQFDVVRARGVRSSDPSTSARSAAMIEPKAESDQGKALAAFRAANGNGLTAHEVESLTGIDGIWRRVSELHQKGLIEVVGERVDRVTRKPCRVFRPTSQASLF